jgi:hypothetical protein
VIPAFFVSVRTHDPGTRASPALRTNQTMPQKPASFLRSPATKCRDGGLSRTLCVTNNKKGSVMNSIIYLVGLVVVVMAVLSFVGLH